MKCSSEINNTTAMAVQFRTSNTDNKDATKTIHKTPFRSLNIYTWNILDTWGEFYQSDTILNEQYSMTLTS